MVEKIGSQLSKRPPTSLTYHGYVDRRKFVIPTTLKKSILLQSAAHLLIFLIYLFKNNDVKLNNQSFMNLKHVSKPL